MRGSPKIVAMPSEAEVGVFHWGAEEMPGHLVMAMRLEELGCVVRRLGPDGYRAAYSWHQCTDHNFVILWEAYEREEREPGQDCE